MSLCPKCPGKLDKIEVEGIELDYCDSCEGIWFDKDELQKVLIKDKFNTEISEFEHEMFDGKEIPNEIKDMINESSGRCPKCNDRPILKHKILKKNKKDIKIEKCSECDGIWLDGGEINLIRTKYLKDIADKNIIVKKICGIMYKYLK